MWALQLYIVLFAKLPDPIPGAPGVRFSIRLQPRDQYPVLYIKTVPRPLFILSPRGAIFSIPRPGTHAHVQNYQINACMFDSLQILFTSGIWFSCVQVLGHHTPVQPLQVYNQHWHVIIPSESQLHLQSHPLKFSFRVPISGSAVPPPPLHFWYCHPVALSPT
jgi:hypothetical protein